MKTDLTIIGASNVLGSWIFYRVNSDWALDWPFNFVVTMAAVSILLGGLMLIIVGLWPTEIKLKLSA